MQSNFLPNTPTVTRNLIFVNVVVFILTLINKRFMMLNFALFYPTSDLFHWWQPVTHMFMHGGFWHILFNMYTLFLFGSVVERIIGEKKFLVFYFLCGFGAVALHLGVQYLELQSYINGAELGNQFSYQHIAEIKSVPTVGASGAIYGVLIAYAMLFPDSRMTLLFPPVTLSAKWMVICFAALELITGMNGMQAGVAHFAHLGGMLIGWLTVLYWKNRNILFDRDRIV